MLFESDFLILCVPFVIVGGKVWVVVFLKAFVVNPDALQLFTGGHAHQSSGSSIEQLGKIVYEHDSLEWLDVVAIVFKEKDKYNEAPVCPEYTLPPTWEELFTLKSSNKAINKLYIQSEIERVAKNHADWKKESLEQWEHIINENNYKDYDKDYKE